MRHKVKKPSFGRLVSVGARGVASIADQGASAAVGFLASVFIGRLIGAEALGIYAITNVFVMLIRAFQNSLILEPMSVYGARRKNEEKIPYFGFLIRLELVWSGFLVSLLIAGSIIAWRVGKIDLQMLYALIAGGIYTFLLCFQYLLRRQFYIDLQQYLAMIQSLSFLLLIAVGFAFMWRGGGWTVVDVYILLSVCSVIVCLAQSRRFWKQTASPDLVQRRRYLQEHWSYGKWVLLAVPLGLATYQGYFFIAGSLISTEAAGLLKASDTLVAPFFQVSVGLGLMLTPMASKVIDRMSVAAQTAYALAHLAPAPGTGSGLRRHCLFRRRICFTRVVRRTDRGGDSADQDHGVRSDLQCRGDAGRHHPVSAAQVQDAVRQSVPDG